MSPRRLAGLLALLPFLLPAGLWAAEDLRQPADRLPKGSPLRQAAQAVGSVIAASGAGSSVRETGTGVLIAPCVVLTARHVLGDEPPAHGEARAIEIRFRRLDGKGDDLVRATANVASVGGGRFGMRSRSVLDDWALLRLDKPPESIRPVPLDYTDCCRPGLNGVAALVGFPADHYDADRPMPWVDSDCAITERLANRILATNCLATSGNSGGPVLVRRGEDWRVGGVLIRADPLDAEGKPRRADNFAVPADSFLRRRAADADQAAVAANKACAKAG